MGLETGIESVGYINEYQNQIDYLKSIPSLQAVTMSQFANKYKSIYPALSEVRLKDNKSEWVLSTNKRENTYHQDKIVYQNNLSFQDYFTADRNDFLNRRLPELYSQTENKPYMRLHLLILLGLYLFSIFKRKQKLFLATLLLSLTSYGLILRSFMEYGWGIYFGPIIPLLMWVQVILVLVSALLVYCFTRIVKKFNLNPNFIFVLPFSLSIFSILYFLRFSIIDGRYYIGVMLDVFHFIGISVSPSIDPHFMSLDFRSPQAAALLKIDFSKLWSNPWIYLFINPILGFTIASFLISIIRKWSITTNAIILFLILSTLLHLFYIFNLDPLFVLALK